MRRLEARVVVGRLLVLARLDVADGASHRVGAPLLVAVEAGLVQGLLGELPVARRTVRVMAAAAVHLALPHRVGVRFEHLRALLLVAVEADRGLGRRHQDRVALDMTVVAVGTRNGVLVVRAAVPAKADVALVTVQAIRVLLRDRCAAVPRPDESGPGRALPVAGPLGQQASLLVAVAGDADVHGEIAARQAE